MPDDRADGGISFVALHLVQGADQKTLLRMGEVVFPGFVERSDGGQLRVWVDRGEGPRHAAVEASARFQTLLGILRAWRSDAGELRIEAQGGLGVGAVADRAGNQTVMVGTVKVRVTFGNEVATFAQAAREAMLASQNLRNALWLNGRTDRTSADYYMIHEYARQEFGGDKGIREALGLSTNDQDRLTASANNLSPLLGGRHAKGRDSAAVWDLHQQRDFVAELMRGWIAHLAGKSSA